MRIGADESTYEDIVGTPEEVVEDGRWLSSFTVPRSPDSLKWLTATCLPGWHTVRVGETFRWGDEQVRLDATRTTTLEGWLKLRHRRRMGYGPHHDYVLHCERCGKDQTMWVKGYEWA